MGYEKQATRCSIGRQIARRALLSNRVKPTWVLLALAIPLSMGKACDPKTAGESAAGRVYVPTDALPVEVISGCRDLREEQNNQLSKAPKLGGALAGGLWGTLLSHQTLTAPKSSEPGHLAVEPGAPSEYVPLLAALPDNTVRLSVQEIELGGGVTFGSSQVTASGSFYRAVADYINATTISVGLIVRQDPNRSSGEKEAPQAEARTTRAGQHFDRLQERSRRPEREKVLDWEVIGTFTNTAPGSSGAGAPEGCKIVYIPVYVGIGLRLEANIFATEANLNISAMSGVGAQAEYKGLSGSLVVQTLGVSGEKVTAALPIPSELDNTAVQNALVSLATIKALLFDETTFVRPRVVGFTLPDRADNELVAQIVSVLMKPGAVKWKRPCLAPPPAEGGHTHSESDPQGPHTHPPPP